MLDSVLSILPQLAILAILTAAFVLFLRNRIRYDVIAVLIMLAVVATGVMDYREVFTNFGHPAIIIVASMFIMSEAFVRSGIVDSIVSRLTFFYTHPVLGLGALVILVTLLSAFVNNAGALAMTIPIAIHLARKSHTPIAFFLLPLAFASHLGGFLTLIGTPRNIIISEFRETFTGAPFAMFDFFYVGSGIALVGCIFLIAVSWRLIPFRRSDALETPPLRLYTSEVVVRPESKLLNLSPTEFMTATRQTLTISAIYRDNQLIAQSAVNVFVADDTLIVQGEMDSLLQLSKQFGLTLVGIRAEERFVSSDDDYTTVEAVVPPYAKVIGTTWDDITWQKRFGTNFLGLFRRDATLTSHIAHTTFWPNDILILTGRADSVNETVRTLQLLPLADPEVRVNNSNTSLLTFLLLATAIGIATLNILPLAVIFLTTAVLFILLNIVSLRQAYDSIDQPVLILLAGMITLGQALQASGAAESMAAFLLSLDIYLGPTMMLVVILMMSMFLADFMNTTASAVIMAPIAILVAQTIGVSIDPFLIAVAIGASCAFLTPVGHESNAIVMKQGGYTFKDYFRVGLPLEILIVLTSIPLILHFWPF